MSNDSDRPWTVKYYDTDLHLTGDEYQALKKVTYDDPLEAWRLADEFLQRTERGAARTTLRAGHYAIRDYERIAGGECRCGYEPECGFHGRGEDQ